VCNVDISIGSSTELVDKFCHVRDMLFVDSGADDGSQDTRWLY